VAKCLEKAPSARYQHPAELLTALENSRDAIPATKPKDDWVLTATMAIGSEHLPPGAVDRSQQYATVIAPSTRTTGGFGAGQTFPKRPLAPPIAVKNRPALLYAIGGAVIAILVIGGILLATAGGGSDDDGSGNNAAAGAGATAAAAASATAALGVAPTVGPTPVPPDRTNCDEIRGTQYRSQAEQAWFNANCLPPPETAPAPGPAVQAPAAVVAPAVVAPVVAPPVAAPPVVAPPASAASYSVYGFYTDITGSGDPPGGTASSGSSIGACNPPYLFVWVDYTNAPVPVTFSGRWSRAGTLLDEISFSQTAASGRMYWRLVGPSGVGIRPATYVFEVYQGSSRLTSGSVTLTC